MARIVIVDDDELRRDVVRDAFERRSGFDVVGQADDEGGCLDVVRESQPDVVVLDLGRPSLAGVGLLGRLRTLAPRTGVVVRSAATRDEAPATGGDGRGADDSDLHPLVAALERLLPVPVPRRQASIRLAADVASPAHARRHVQGTCRAWHIDDVIDAAALVVSELVTNAVIHAGSSCELRLALHTDIARIGVADASTSGPAPAPLDADQHGRGLLLVDAVSVAWGVEPAGRQVRVGGAAVRVIQPPMQAASWRRGSTGRVG